MIIFLWKDYFQHDFDINFAIYSLLSYKKYNLFRIYYNYLLIVI